MDEKKESFKHVSVDYPTDYSTHANFVLFDFDEFDKWLGRLEDAHEREVDRGVAGMTNAQLADHGLCRIGSAAMWDEVRDTKDRELSEEHGLVRLPVDADGVPIHIGDRLTEPEFVPKGGKVVGIKLYSSLDNWLVNCGAWVDPRKCHHHHEPTVEDVLREFAYGLGETIQQVMIGEGGVPATDENMAKHGLARLPVDADGYEGRG